VRGAHASDAAYERMQELHMMKQLRDQEVEKAEQEERERKSNDKRLREVSEIISHVF